MNLFLKEKFDDIKGVTIIRKSKDRQQYNDQNKKDNQ